MSGSQILFNINFITELCKLDYINKCDLEEFINLNNNYIYERKVITSLTYDYSLNYDIYKVQNFTKTVIKISDNFKFKIDYQLKKTLNDNNISSINNTV